MFRVTVLPATQTLEPGVLPLRPAQKAFSSLAEARLARLSPAVVAAMNHVHLITVIVLVPGTVCRPARTLAAAGFYNRI